MMTGLITLVLAAVLRLVWVGFSADFYSAWMEAWLTSWPIVFPFAYLLNAPVSRLAALIAAPAVTLEAGRATDLSLAQIADASANATAINGLSMYSAIAATPVYLTRQHASIEYLLLFEYPAGTAGRGFFYICCSAKNAAECIEPNYWTFMRPPCFASNKIRADSACSRATRFASSSGGRWYCSFSNSSACSLSSSCHACLVDRGDGIELRLREVHAVPLSGRQTAG